MAIADKRVLRSSASRSIRSSTRGRNRRQRGFEFRHQMLGPPVSQAARTWPPGARFQCEGHASTEIENRDLHKLRAAVSVDDRRYQVKGVRDAGEGDACGYAGVRYTDPAT